MNRTLRTSIVRILEIDAGHRLHNHEGKCKDLHGHRYKFEITLEAEELDDVGRVVDFGVVKSIVGNWLDQNWDHGMILSNKDPVSLLYTDKYYHQSKLHGMQPSPLYGMKYFLLPCNPTAENLAGYLHTVANQLMKEKNTGIQITNIVCWETPNCLAIAESD